MTVLVAPDMQQLGSELEAAARPKLVGGLLSIQLANDVARLFQALSDPTRLRIIALLMDHELCVHTITELLDMSQSAVSHQLRTMRDLRLVRARKAGRHVFYSLDDAHVRDMFTDGLAHSNHLSLPDTGTR